MEQAKKDGMTMEKVGIYTLIGSGALSLTFLNFFIGGRFTGATRRVIEISPVYILGAGVAIIGGGRALQRNKTLRENVEAGGLVLLGTSIIAVPLTLTIPDDPRYLEGVVYAEVILGVLGALMVGLAEDRAKVINWKD